MLSIILIPVLIYDQYNTKNILINILKVRELKSIFYLRWLQF
jgi:hypothetical protein